MRWPIVIVMVIMFVPPWSGVPRRALYRSDLTVAARAYVPPGGWPKRIGALRPIGAITLTADQPGFGGFSALLLHHGQAILLNDGGLVVRVRIARGVVHAQAGSSLDDGPGTGWRTDERDTESMTIDPVSGRTWIGYERCNEIWRYAPDLAHAEAWTRPAAMRNWGINSGAESLVRLADGRFLALREGGVWQVGARPAVLFDRDPTQPGALAVPLRYLPPVGFAPSDAAQLPNGDLLVLNRRWRLPLRFDAVLVRISRTQLHRGMLLHGPVIARFGTTMGGENAEGLAIAREGGATTLWLITDNDGFAWRRTILAKFRLVE